VPTVAESGLPGFDVTSWYGIVTRAGTPPAIVHQIQHDMADALAEDEVRTKLAGLGLEPDGSTPEAFEAKIRREAQKWGDIVRKAGIKVE
jgi:tripartite-type tricarboxylate transporter receptor subunit TctC